MQTAYAEFHPNLSVNVERTDRNLLDEVTRGFHCADFREAHSCWRALCRNRLC